MVARRILMLVLLGACAPAHASPRSDPTSGRAVFTGATMPHATALALDPAALGLSQVDQLYIAVTGLVDQLHASLDKIDLDTGAHSPGARVKNIEASPGAMIAFIYHVAGDQFTLGFEARTNPRESFPEGRSALRYQTLGGGERDWFASVGGSFRLTGDLLVGASLSHQNTFLRLKFARDTALENGHAARGLDSDCGGAPCGVENPQATEQWDVGVRSRLLSTSNLRVNIGAVYQLARDMWLGVGYHTPPGFAVQSELGGNVDVVRAPRDGGGPIHGGSVVEIQFPASVDAELRFRLPGQLDVHIAGRWEDLSRLQAYDVRTYGSTLPRLGIPEWTERPRGLQDSFAVWGGVEQVDAGGPPRFLYGARIGYETGAVSDERTSALTVVPASLTLDLGVQRRISRGAILQVSYGLQYYPTVNATNNEFDPRSRVACLASGVDYDLAACEAVRDGYAIPTAAGTYERIEHAVRIGLRYDIQ